MCEYQSISTHVCLYTVMHRSSLGKFNLNSDDTERENSCEVAVFIS